jgi:hypothetical protein
LPAYAVKHLAYEKKRGPIARIMKRVKAQPYSLTSKELEASNAIGSFVFVIEVCKEAARTTTYRLGYKYRAADKVTPAGGGKWEGEFRFKNIAHYPAEGQYLDPAVQITDKRTCEWLSKKQPGMAEIPPHLVEVLGLR